MYSDSDAELDNLRHRISRAYLERDILAAALAATLRTWTVELDERQRPVLLIDLPDVGQVSFHVAFDYRNIQGFGVRLDDNGEWTGVSDRHTWDGHSKDVALDRLRQYTRRAAGQANDSA